MAWMKGVAKRAKLASLLFIKGRGLHKISAFMNAILAIVKIDTQHECNGRRLELRMVVVVDS